ncbi:glycosyl transferase [Burkholderia multivorans]|uniref:glycosyltransferase n=1 Tax=Burkholderia multivorans TaxID=87883 RepID=UPI001C258491|nr:glycosyltransferase [Burkholderia multivorans]MBU9548147.1 glycosyl transferase [Burkholderia multivorans]
MPVEPLPVVGRVNRLMWRRTIAQIVEFCGRAPTVVVVGKPSALALEVIARLPGTTSLYDAMDDFPAFYTGLSRAAMARNEQLLVQRVTHIAASATFIMQRWSNLRTDIRLVHNGLDADALPEPKVPAARNEQSVFGYVGTIAAWFDWDWVIALAHARPHDLIKLIGPLFEPAGRVLPPNIELHPQRMHVDALAAMREFDVGLIPFRRTLLTQSVDPIKYYEYRALGLPVISTRFGEMIARDGEEGTFINNDVSDIAASAARALRYRPNAEAIELFRRMNDWDARFTQLDQLLELPKSGAR